MGYCMRECVDMRVCGLLLLQLQLVWFDCDECGVLGGTRLW